MTAIPNDHIITDIMQATQGNTNLNFNRFCTDKFRSRKNEIIAETGPPIKNRGIQINCQGSNIKLL
jgi:hypothetical protein